MNENSKNKDQRNSNREVKDPQDKPKVSKI